jgi:hypothetical protein
MWRQISLGLGGVVTAALSFWLTLAILTRQHGEPSPASDTASDTPSENFSHANWHPSDVTLSGSVRDRAPDGSQSGTPLVESAENVRHFLYIITEGARPGAVHTFSIYVKPAGRTRLMLEIRDGAQPGRYGTGKFDLDAGMLDKNGDIVDLGIEAAGGGWFRCWAAMPYNTNQAVLGMYPADKDGGIVFKGDGNPGLLLWGAQFEPGSRPSGYSSTTAAPS